ncbi:MAG: type pilus assembly protein PilE [Patescibacteria group bacterium]|jgi:prepilin-type N-terminal cleavage/methylation domain-containing protein|nr:type pilus assembly protein PilE [Patescibacteria group bacterium]
MAINRKKTGFTLIELMVVIVIIGILATLGLVSFQNALRRSRNTKRIGDAKDYAAAQEQIRALTGNYVGVGTTCPTTVGEYSVQTSPGGADPYLCNTTAGTGFCFDAQLEGGETGNCGSCTGPGTTNANTGDSFCVVSKQ